MLLNILQNFSLRSRKLAERPPQLSTDPCRGLQQKSVHPLKRLQRPPEGALFEPFCELISSGFFRNSEGVFEVGSKVLHKKLKIVPSRQPLKSSSKGRLQMPLQIVGGGKMSSPTHSKRRSANTFHAPTTTSFNTYVLEQASKWFDNISTLLEHPRCSRMVSCRDMPQRAR